MKNTEKKNEAKELVKPTNEIAMPNIGAAFEIAEKLEKAEQITSLNEDYLEIKEGERKRLVFLGIEPREAIDEDTGEVEEVQAALFIDANKKRLYGFQSTLVSTLKRFSDKAPIPVEVEYKGTKKSKNSNRSYQDFDVFLLSI